MTRHDAACHVALTHEAPVLHAGRTQAVIADNIMSILVPPRESGAAPIDKTASFQQVKHPQDNVGGNN